MALISAYRFGESQRRGERLVEDEGHRNPRPYSEPEGGHSMRRPGLADRILSQGQEYYAGRRRGNSGWYHAPGKRAMAKHDHANTLRGELKAGGLTKDRIGSLVRALRELGESPGIDESEWDKPTN